MKYICTHCKEEIRFEDQSYELNIYNLDEGKAIRNVLCENCMNKIINEGKL